MIEKKYLLLKEIVHADLGKIYSPITEDIINLTDEQYNKLLLPFMITMDDFEFDKSIIENIETQLGRKFTVFDYLTSNKSTIGDMINSLKFFYRTEHIQFNLNCFFINCNLANNQLIKYDNPVILSFANWDNLCGLIKDLMWLSNAKKEERKVTVEHEENNPILQEYLRLRKQQEEENRKLAQKNALTIHDIVTVVASDCLWDYDRVLKMTYYRLVLSYRAIMSKDNYETSLRYHTSYKFDTSNMKIEHWTDSMKKG